MATPEQNIRIWRMRADEYRAASDNCMYIETKVVYDSLARNYERLADREERRLKADADARAKRPGKDRAS